MLCGLTGWGLEILLTSVEGFAAGDMKFMGKTSIYMFPIYGMGILLGPIGKWVDSWIGDRGQIAVKDRIFRHGILDMVLIFFAEYLTGTFLKSLGICPWDYTGRMLNVDGVIRLDFAPFWFMTGLLFEYLTGGKRKSFPEIRLQESQCLDRFELDFRWIRGAFELQIRGLFNII